MEWLPHVAAIHARTDDLDAPWSVWLTREFESLGMPFFATDGTLRERGVQRPTGRYDFIDASQCASLDLPWMRASPCPYVGPILGFVTWEWWTTGCADHDLLARGLLFAGRGCLGRTDGDVLFEGVVEEEFPLADFAAKHGFHDGDFFWSDSVYSEYVRGTLVCAVERLGLTPELFTGGTSHNPHRLNQFVPRRGQTFASCWEHFNAHQHQPVKLWGYNISGMKSAAYRALITEV